jgi:hypothetical protein
MFTLLFRVYFRLVDFAYSFYNRLFNTARRHVTFPVRSRPADEIYFLSATEAARRIREGRLMSKELVEAYVNRVRVVNSELNAVVYDCGTECLKQVSGVPKVLGLISQLIF